MKRNIIILVVLLVIGLLIYIFYPKNCGQWVVVPGVDRTECKCLGFKTIANENLDGAGGRNCWGLAIWNK